MNKSELVKQATKWWTDQLGDRLCYPLTQMEKSAFQTCLGEEITEFLSDKCWDPDRPNHGSARRMIYCDWGPSYILSDAAERAGFDIYDYLPIKTIMWINPDGIKIQVGYKQPIVPLRADSVFQKVRQMINDWTKIVLRRD